MAYVAVTIEGGLFPADLLDRLAAGELPGQRPEDFGLPKSRRLTDEIQAAFSDLRSYWDAFQRRKERSRESATTLTREAWVIPFLERLDYKPVFQRRAAVVETETFHFSHRASEDPEAPPIHIVSYDQPLDRRGEGRRSPHALMQEYLNRSDALWGLVTNGEKLRLLRHTPRVARPVYLEFDLPALLEGNLYSEFVLLYRLLHRSRLPRTAAEAHQCWLEKYYQQGIEEGGRVRDRLRDGVEEALKILGTAFLVHPDSHALRQAIQEGRLKAEDYYRQLLRLIYRLLFLMVAEERRLLFPPEGDPARQAIYTCYYSLSRLREQAERFRREDLFSDLWLGLRETFRLFRDQGAAQMVGLAALDGELFSHQACPDLEAAALDNHRLLTALFHLSTFSDGQTRRRVNFAHLDTEELGSIYESLLDFHPVVSLDPPGFDLVSGSERKSTGSYYTPPELVRELVESALVPVLTERLARAHTREEKEKAILGLRVCDPASGSGHFLLAAARRLGRELATVRTGEAEPAPLTYREAVRDIIRTCLYAVDKNPLAVDLCKVALWLEGHFPGLPLSFLDHHIKCGDSLVGIFGLGVLLNGIPDAAYTPVTGDDKRVAALVKKKNQEEREGHASLFREQVAQAVAKPKELAPEFAALAALAEIKPEDVQAKEELYQSLRQGPAWWRLKVAGDLWTGAFFAPLQVDTPGGDPPVPTTGLLWRALAQGQADPRVEGAALALAEQNRFFHWPLEFPEVFAAGGFDVVLGNPPWERIKLQEQEFFAGRDPGIARAPNRAARERLIRRLQETNPGLYAEFQQAKHQAEAQSLLVRYGGRFPLAGRGDINTYAVFAELMRTLLNPRGRAGIIVPSGIATDDTTKFFFQDLMEKGSLVSLFDFENRQRIFPGIDSRIKFCLLTLAGGREAPGPGAEFAFFLQQVADLKDEARRLRLSAADLALLNPNTRTCPIFRCRRDLEITKGIYQRVPVLVKDGPPEENPWGIKFSTMFHMANDSHLFRTREELGKAGYVLKGNIFVRPEVAAPEPMWPDPARLLPLLETDREAVWLPLYEAKMMHHFDHRWATYEGRDTRDVTLREKQDPRFVVQPRYWVQAAEVVARSARAPRELCRAWREEQAEEALTALVSWWWGDLLHKRKTVPQKLGELALRLDLNRDRARKLAREFPLSESELTVLAQALPHLRLPPGPEALTLAHRLLAGRLPRFLLGWRDIARSIPLKIIEDVNKDYVFFLICNLATFSFDYVARQCMGGTHLTFFIYKQLPILAPSTYARHCPWDPELRLADWLTPRVLELTYTAWDLTPFARELGYGGPPFPWDEDRRFLIRCELDAAYFHLYGLSREEAAYILETFPIVKRKDEDRFGEYRTQRVILEIYDAFRQAMQTGRPYALPLTPPPGQQ